MNAINIDDLRRLARKRLPRSVFEFIDGGSQDEHTLRANQSDFSKLRFIPRVLTEIGRRDQGMSLFGQHYTSPLILAPTGLAGLLARRGELQAARAARQAGVPYCLSTMATCSIEQIATEAPVPHWFQLYVLRDRELTREFIARARAANCSALVLTVDTKFQGPRERDMRNGFTVPPRFTFATWLDFAMHWRWLIDVGLGPKIKYRNFDNSSVDVDSVMSITDFIAKQWDITLTWKDVEWFKSQWQGPVLIKGLLSPHDASKAIDAGVDGVIVSNHGGRQLDGAISSIAALPAVTDAVAGRVPVILDGGVRRGADVVKAVALGATGCMIGRPWLYGLAVAGEAGVRRALKILHDEIDITLGLLVFDSLAALDRSVIAD